MGVGAGTRVTGSAGSGVGLAGARVALVRVGSNWGAAVSGSGTGALRGALPDHSTNPANTTANMASAPASPRQKRTSESIR